MAQEGTEFLETLRKLKSEKQSEKGEDPILAAPPSPNRLNMRTRFLLLITRKARGRIAERSSYLLGTHRRGPGKRVV